MIALIIYVITFIYLIIMSIEDIKKKQVSLLPGIILLGIITITVFVFRVELISRLLGAAVGVFLYMVSKISKGEIGEADAFVFMITGITLGIYHNVEVLLVSLLLASLVSAFLLIIKRVNRKYKIPFIPFILAGYFGIASLDVVSTLTG